jgi:threonine synthase
VRLSWTLECSGCRSTSDAEGLPGVCAGCGSPLLVRYPSLPPPSIKPQLAGRQWDMWRYREWLPLAGGENPISLGEGGTPLLRVTVAGVFNDLWIKDEGPNPTGSFKARGMAAALTRAVGAGASRFVVPTAGNAGVALAAYAARARASARVYAPRSTPRTILQQIRTFGAELELLDGHIGDCGKAARAYAHDTGAVDVSTLREPYRIEGKKTLGLEIAEQLDWTLPDAIVYPAGGGTGLIGMWKAFQELQSAGWVTGNLPRMYAVQAQGCAPVVKALLDGADRCEPWPDPQTVAAGLRVPGPLGDRLMLRALRESGGGAIAVSDENLSRAATELQVNGIDAAPEGGAALQGAYELLSARQLAADQRVVVFNTGAGWLYRS